MGESLPLSVTDKSRGIRGDEERYTCGTALAIQIEALLIEPSQ
jgi:hypothetical protein